MKTYPPVSEMSADDLLELCAATGRDPALSYDLAGSRAHVEVVCKLAVKLAQRLAEATEERDDLKVRAQHGDESRTRLGDLAAECLDDVAAAERDNRALQQQVAALTNERDVLAGELRAARQAIADREDEIGRVNNLRQSEVTDAAAQRQRGDNAEAAAEVFEMTARAALAVVTRPGTVTLAEVVKAVDGRLARALTREQAISAALGAKFEETLRRLEEMQETAAHNDRLHSAFGSACEAVTGDPIDEFNLKLDAELAAHPEPGPLHHARDQREPDVDAVLDEHFERMRPTTDAINAGFAATRPGKGTP